jgi:hypothetical protein
VVTTACPGDTALGHTPHCGTTHTQVEQHAVVLPALLAVVTAQEQQASAAAGGSVAAATAAGLQERAVYALDAFCEALEPQEIAPYMPAVMSQLVAVLARGGGQAAHAGVQEVALSAIASAASAARADFAPHLSTVLPALSHFMAATSRDLLPCRCKAMEVMGIVMEHLGSSAHTPLAQLAPGVMEASLSGWHTLGSGACEIREYSHALWASMAKGLGGRFASYVSVVAPLALESLAQEEGDVALGGGGGGVEEEAGGVGEGSGGAAAEEDIGDGASSSGSEDGGDLPRYHVHSGVLDEKCAAMQALGMYAAHVEGAAGEGAVAVAPFAPYLEAAVQCALHLADEAWHEELQIQAVEALPRLLQCAGRVSVAAADTARTAACARMLQLLAAPDRAVVTATLGAWRELLQQPGAGGALTPWLQQMCEGVAAVLGGTAPCSEFVQEEDDDDDGSDGGGGEGGGGDAEEELFAAAADVLPVLVSAVGADVYAPVLAALHLPALLSRFPQQHGAASTSRPSRRAQQRLMLDEEGDDLRGVALGAIAEVAERMQAHMAPHLPHLIPVIVSELRSREAINRQNAAFAAGVIVEGCGGAAAAPWLPHLLPALHPLFTNPKESPGTRDNAVGCVARMVLAAAALDTAGHTGGLPEGYPLPLEAVLPAMCAALPPQEDWAESGVAYRALCVVLPHTILRLPQPVVAAVVAALAQGAVEPRVPDSVRAGISACVGRVLRSPQRDALQAAAVACGSAAQPAVAQLLTAAVAASQ